MPWSVINSISIEYSLPMSTQFSSIPAAAYAAAIVQEVISGDPNFGIILAAGTVVDEIHTNYLSGLLVKIVCVHFVPYVLSR